jgi:hypothetical protein
MEVPPTAVQNPDFLGLTGDRTCFQILTCRGIDIEPFSAVRRRCALCPRRT